MSLDDDLKARTLALISQQMANWVVAIQKQILQHQESLVRSLDEMQESVARYDERINEAEIEVAIAEVLAQQPPPMPTGVPGPAADLLKASISEIEKGTSLSEVLTFLVNEVSKMAERSAMFIIKGSNAIGWYSRGFAQPDAIKQITVPLNGDTVFRIVHNSRHALSGHISHSPGTQQAMARMGGSAQGILAVPLILRDKLAAILYCDSSQEEIPATDSAGIEILVLFAAKVIDILSLVPKAATSTIAPGAPAAQSAPIAHTPAPQAARSTGVGPAPAIPRPAVAPPPAADEGGATVMFRGSAAANLRQPAAPAVPSRPSVAIAPSLSPEDQKAHDDAKRFARLVVSEIKLYNEAKVTEGRRAKDIYERLREDIERGRQMYSDRVPANIRDATNYFYDELVRILAGGDPSSLGPM
ncbi:MAG: hypothetical protein MUF51_11625 [Vicinamibacteria bacterium]|jgi:hypothetical protein|nr:hypothetical protein [Vicinamibacteria bacterium]